MSVSDPAVTNGVNYEVGEPAFMKTYSVRYDYVIRRSE